MPAFQRPTTKTLLSPLVLVWVLAAPQVFAKKDLFATDPGSNQSSHIEQLAPNVSSSSASTAHEPTTADHKIRKEESVDPTAETEKDADAPPSYLEKQFARFKTNLTEAKEDLFGNKKSPKKDVPSVPEQTEATIGDNANSSEGIQIPTISAAEAAQRAQALAEGQVINVRKYQEEDKPRYAVKLLQKNGRMKTINLDAVSGALIEDIPQ
jgi:uncharacterized membrane protein YkoI